MNETTRNMFHAIPFARWAWVKWNLPIMRLFELNRGGVAAF
jgi:hypothetical protein